MTNTKSIKKDILVITMLILFGTTITKLIKGIPSKANSIQ